MSRDIAQFLINPDTKTPLADVLKISRVLDSLHPTELPEFNEKYMLGLFYRFATYEEPTILEEDASSMFLNWFNENMLERFIDEGMSDNEYKLLVESWQDVK